MPPIVLTQFKVCHCASVDWERKSTWLVSSLDLFSQCAWPSLAVLALHVTRCLRNTLALTRHVSGLVDPDCSRSCTRIVRGEYFVHKSPLFRDACSLGPDTVEFDSRGALWRLCSRRCEGCAVWVASRMVVAGQRKGGPGKRAPRSRFRPSVSGIAVTPPGNPRGQPCRVCRDRSA